MLAHQEKVVVLGNHDLVDQCPCRHVPVSSLVHEESLTILYIHHDSGYGGLGLVCFFDFGNQLAEVELLVDGDLVPCAAVEKNHQLFGNSPITVKVGR